MDQSESMGRSVSADGSMWSEGGALPGRVGGDGGSSPLVAGSVQADCARVRALHAAVRGVPVVDPVAVAFDGLVREAVVPARRWREDLFDRLVREAVVDQAVSCRVRRSRYVVWRWWAVLLLGGEVVDERLCLTRWGAGRRAGRMVAAECAWVAAQLDSIAVELFGGGGDG